MSGSQWPPGSLLATLRCPRCRGRLAWRGAEAACRGCGNRYPPDDDLPALLPTELGRHELAQAREHAAPPDSRTDRLRPRGTPAFHGWLLVERLRRSTEGMEGLLAGATAAAVCGGSGMDAEWLARQGASVLCLDVSAGALRRARWRAEVGHLPILPALAVAERLPLADRGVDVAVVHDGLHHLADPNAGLLEVARVAARAVIVSEPAEAALTRLAVRLGAADERESAGNRVARLDRRAVVAMLRAQGFCEVRVRRFPMHYDPDVGSVARLLSRRRLVGPAQRVQKLAMALAAPVGNKLIVQALRPTAHAEPIVRRSC